MWYSHYSGLEKKRVYQAAVATSHLSLRLHISDYIICTCVTHPVTMQTSLKWIPDYTLQWMMVQFLSELPSSVISMCVSLLQFLFWSTWHDAWSTLDLLDFPNVLHWLNCILINSRNEFVFTNPVNCSIFAPCMCGKMLFLGQFIGFQSDIMVPIAKFPLICTLWSFRWRWRGYQC